MSRSVSVLAQNGGPQTRTAPFPPWPIYDERDAKALTDVLKSGQWGSLAEDTRTAELEQAFADKHEAKHGIAVNSGSAALVIALRAAGVGHGDEVIVPPYTFLATATAVLEVNATPVFADVDLETYNLSPRTVRAALSERTRALIPVHFGGHAAEMAELQEICEDRNLTLIEDAAHAHGAQYRGQSLGAIGDMGCFSFQSSKNLNAGEGGMILSNDDELAARCRSYCNYGRVATGGNYEHHLLGSNHRMTEFQAALLLSQLERLDEQTIRRHENGAHLSNGLADIPGIVPQKQTDDATRHSRHVYLFRVVAAEFGIDRDTLVQALQAEGVPCFSGYKLPLYQQPLFLNHNFRPAVVKAPDYGAVNCHNCETLCDEAVFVTQNLLLGERSDVDDIVSAVQKIYNHRSELIS